MVDIILSGIINYNCYIAHLNVNEMTNLDKYKAAFVNSLSIDIKLLEKNLEYNTINEWDSIGHMTLISEIETQFSITMETDDIIDFSSFNKGKEILQKYKIEIE
jgi:acyl carrier protein